jgi:hypothetical protein
MFRRAGALREPIIISYRHRDLMARFFPGFLYHDIECQRIRMACWLHLDHRLAPVIRTAHGSMPKKDPGSWPGSLIAGWVRGWGGWGARHPTCDHNVRSSGRFRTETNFSDRAAPQQLVVTYFTTFSALVRIYLRSARPNFTTLYDS